MQVLIQFINLHNWMNQTSDDVTVLWQWIVYLKYMFEYMLNGPLHLLCWKVLTVWGIVATDWWLHAYYNMEICDGIKLQTNKSGYISINLFLISFSYKILDIL